MATLEALPRTIFEEHEDYPKLLAGAHRRSATPIAAPAAVRHLAFWKPPQRGAKTSISASDDPLLPVLQRRAEADTCIAAVYKALLEHHRTSPPVCEEIKTNSEIRWESDRLIILFAGVIDAATGEPRPCPDEVTPDSYRAIKISARWRGILTNLSFELHAEYLALTTILDLSERKSPDQLQALKTRWDPKLKDFFDALSGLAAATPADEEACQTVHDRLYHIIWRRVEEELLAPLKSRGAALGKNFVDFRGIVLGTTEADGAQGAEGTPKFSAPFSPRRPSPGTGQEREARCCIKDFDKLWNFVTCALPSETEFTLSRFLEDRAFYATALGVQPDVFVESKPKPAPLYYLLFEDTLNPLQLGRTIDRVHRAGVARIAAIMHFDELRQASNILKTAEGLLESAIWEMSKFGDLEKNPKLRPELKKYQADVEVALSGISGLQLNGTLDFRIERSRYYANQFARMASALRIKRVVGFQPYDEFVNQRMGPAFEFIQSLGRINARVQNDRSALQGRIQALDSLYNEGLIASAQRIADIALSCVLGPYYAAAIISHSLSGIVEARSVWLGAAIFGFLMYVAINIRERSEKVEAVSSERAPPASGPNTPPLYVRLLRRRVVTVLILTAVALLLGILADLVLEALHLPAIEHQTD